MLLRICIILVLATFPVRAQASRAQRASILRQRASVQRQRAAARTVALGVSWAPPVASPVCDSVDTGSLEQMIAFAARVNQVSTALVREVARQESGFHPCAVSRKGAEGLMQLMPATQSTLGVENPFNPAENLMAGARLLRDLLGRYDGNLALALSAYNAGPGRVDEAGGIPAIAETRNYVASILGRLTK